MDTILGIPLGESYSGIHALVDLSMCVKIYQQSPVEVQVATIGEHLHLPPGQALLVVQTKVEFLETSDGLGNHSQQLLCSQRST